MYKLFKSFMFFLVGICFWSTGYANPQTISLYTYHTHVPFITAKGEGLSYDMASFLTKASQGRYTFKVVASSRPRVNKLIEGNSLGIVPWVNPAWFKDQEERKYMWGRSVLMTDGIAILSSRKRSLDYKGPESLKGLIFGGIEGHIYAGVDDYIKNGGDLRRVNASNHAQNIAKIINGDIDATLVPLSDALYSLSQGKLNDQLFVSSPSTGEYERRFIVIGKNTALRDDIDKIMSETADEWVKIVQRYRQEAK